MKLAELKLEFKKVSDPEKAKILSRFFKTKKGEYGEGDIFLGVIVPKQRVLVKKYIDLSLSELQELLNSKIHEYRLTAVLILVAKYKKADTNKKLEIYKFYLKNTKNINNWDLVDLSAPNIVGDYLLDRKRDILYKLADSKMLWERRIAVLATFTFIRDNDFKDILKLAEKLLGDKHDLMHKAVGWMLREMGKRNQKVLEDFLDKNIKKIPRTCLRYAIEKFPEKKRKEYLKK